MKLPITKSAAWGYGLLLALVALLGWASWSEPNLHDYPAPIVVGVLRSSAVPPGPAATRLREQVQQLPGVTACALSADARSVVYMYHPDDTTPAAVLAALPPQYHLHVYEAPAVAPVGPQCPVPTRYLLALDRFRFALNLRRLLVKV